MTGYVLRTTPDSRQRGLPAAGFHSLVGKANYRRVEVWLR
jgi:hypothetical protein